MTAAGVPRPLELPAAVWRHLVGWAYDGLPDEACGLLAGVPGTNRIEAFYPCRNAAASSRVYTVDPRDHLAVDRDAEDHGWQIVGVVHSHTHTDAYPSPTDVAQAPDPTWHYVLVSLRDEAPVVRSYSIVDGAVTEEPIGLVAR